MLEKPIDIGLRNPIIFGYFVGTAVQRTRFTNGNDVKRFDSLLGRYAIGLLFLFLEANL